jgi:hypothetical protein
MRGRDAGSTPEEVGDAWHHLVDAHEDREDMHPYLENLANHAFSVVVQQSVPVRTLRSENQFEFCDDLRVLPCQRLEQPYDIGYAFPLV